jgi:hypothetical protein
MHQPHARQRANIHAAHIHKDSSSILVSSLETLGRGAKVRGAVAHELVLDLLVVVHERNLLSV